MSDSDTFLGLNGAIADFSRLASEAKTISSQRRSARV